MTEELLSTLQGNTGEFKLLPSGGGVFEVTVNGKLVFSKKELGRFPEAGEVKNLVQKELGI